MYNNKRIILGIDSSSSILDIAIFTSHGEVLVDISSNDENTHSERIMPAIIEILKKSGISLNEIDLFACCTGAGSYTGTRVGIATTRGLAFALDKPIKGISSFYLMACNKKGVVAPIIDARCGAVFTSLFENGREIGSPRRVLLSKLESELANKNVVYVEPHNKKWNGITEEMLSDINIIYLGGSV